MESLRLGLGGSPGRRKKEHQKCLALQSKCGIGPDFSQLGAHQNQASEKEAVLSANVTPEATGKLRIKLRSLYFR